MSTAETEAARLLAGDGVASPAGGLPFTGPAAAEASVLLYQEHPLVQLPMYWRWIVLLSVSLLSISGCKILSTTTLVRWRSALRRL
jgi:hypothetical protein